VGGDSDFADVIGVVNMHDLARSCTYSVGVSSRSRCRSCPLRRGANRAALLAIAGVTLAVGGIVWVLPWNRWPRAATWVLLLPTFALIATYNFLADADGEPSRGKSEPRVLVPTQRKGAGRVPDSGAARVFGRVHLAERE
jgi:hypothetical protein